MGLERTLLYEYFQSASFETEDDTVNGYVELGIFTIV